MKQLLKYIIILTLIIFIGKSIYDVISILNSPFTSFPWWAGIQMNIYIFILPLLVELIAYYIISKK